MGGVRSNSNKTILQNKFHFWSCNHLQETLDTGSGGSPAKKSGIRINGLGTKRGEEVKVHTLNIELGEEVKGAYGSHNNLEEALILRTGARRRKRVNRFQERNPVRVFPQQQHIFTFLEVDGSSL